MGAIGALFGESKTPRWHFRDMQPGEINVDPIEGEFFTTEAINSVSEALVRESIQNSLDAAIGNGPVTVRFNFFSQPEKPAGQIADIYLSELTSHLESKDSGLQAIPSTYGSMPYMVIEDFGTKGLQGDIFQYDDAPDSGHRNDFYYFWRNIGRTRKELSDLGRWGLGKTVFQAASRINSFFGLTVRENDGRKLLMGQCVLKIHKMNGKRYSPYGYFGTFKNRLALPIEERTYLERFTEHFDLDRTEQPGLSILIPYPEDEIQPQSCIQAIIKHYFFPILEGKLIAEVRFDQRSFLIDRSSIGKIIKDPQINECAQLEGILDLACWGIEQPLDTYFQLSAPQPGKAPKLREELFNKGEIEKVRQFLHDGKRLAFHVPITIQPTSSNTFTHSAFSVFLERDDTLDRPEDYFVRQGITIPDVTSLKHKGIRALVSITDGSLAAFLGDAENPAHTEWERNSKKFKLKYKLGPTTLDFIKSSPRELVKILVQPNKGRNESLLRHIFSIPSKISGHEGKGKNEAAGKEGESGAPGTGFDINSSNYLKLHRVKGGFGLTRSPNAQSTPKYVAILMAYEVRNGNPFKKYTHLDFDLEKAPIDVRSQGVEILLKRKNALQLEIKEKNFKVLVTGFDTNRDLRIQTNP